MGKRNQLFTRLKNGLSNSPLVSQGFFGFILVGLEKMVELDFQCPCNATWNGVFSSAFFIIPAVMAFTLMLIIQGCRCDSWCRKTVSLSIFVPAIVWLILLFLDGQYFVCAMTDWEGRFVLVDEAAPQKWCEPTREGNVTSQKLMLRSQRWFFESQCLGIALLIVMCISLGVYAIHNCCKQEVETQDADVVELTVLKESSPRTNTS